MKVLRLRRWNQQFHPKVTNRITRKLTRWTEQETVLVDFAGVRGLKRGGLEQLVGAFGKLPVERIRLVGVSSDLWALHPELWSGLDEILAPPAALPTFPSRHEEVA